MNRIIGNRTGKSALDEMEEVARARNADVAEEERLERIEAERKAVEDAERKSKEKERKAMPAVIPVKEEPEVFNGDEMLIKKARETAGKFSEEKYCEKQPLNDYSPGYWLYNHQPEPGWGLHLLDNASMALLHVLLENKTGYKETMKGINRFFPRKTTFFRKRETYYPSHTYGNVCEEPSGYSLEANALMAVLHIAEGSRRYGEEMPFRVANIRSAQTLLEIIEKKSKTQDSFLMTKGNSYIDR